MRETPRDKKAKKAMRRLAGRMLQAAREAAEEGDRPASPSTGRQARPAQRQLVWEGQLPSSGVWGKIERESGGQVTGWLYSPVHSVSPMLFVDGEPADLVAWPLPRRDVSQALGTSEKTGFRFRLPGAKGGAQMELLGLVNNKLEPVDQRLLRAGAANRSTVSQLARAAELAKDPECVAITCWEAGHNPIGRAKVLYDVARMTRPAVLFAYSFEEFGQGLWPPLLGTDTDVVVIPWRQREMYHSVMRELDLSFGTVWMCKPRLPTFLMAAQVARPDARLVLDLDDNEEHFSLSQGSRRKPYGLPSLGRARFAMDQVAARTVASRSLQTDFGGQLVRHARAAVPERELRRARARASRRRGTVKHVAFIGTVRPHKNLLAAARTIRALKWATGREIRFHVMGDVAPDQLKKDLQESGARVGGMVPFDRLSNRLASMDCILTGFPSMDASQEPITRYQISAKIGDALAVGRPVLVPEGPSVNDLASVPGIYLFNEHNFGERLCAALDSTEDVALPPPFSLLGAAEAFDKALEVAESSPRAHEALGSLLPPARPRPASTLRQDTVLLIWKQHDASLYGRRIDQVARAYKRENPASRVVVLELLESSDKDAYAERAGDYTSDAAAILSAMAVKTAGGLTDNDGVQYRALEYDGPSSISSVMEGFLVAEGMFPGNTSVVLFPIMRYYEKFAHVFANYRKTVDFVDNQFSWTNNPKSKLAYARQYNMLARSADQLVFNSDENCKFFHEQGMINHQDPRVKVIPNWYLLPKGSPEQLQPARQSERPTIVYTGNMSDRLDWLLLAELSENLPVAQLLLVGSADRAGELFQNLLMKGNVTYLGALGEQDCLRVLQGADLAVMPHVVDNVSTYMNPLKVHMYEAVGLPTVASDVPGLGSRSDFLIKAQSHDFLEAVQKTLAGLETGRSHLPRSDGSLPAGGQQYVSLLERLVKNGRRIT